jgi:hypothetical protein
MTIFNSYVSHNQRVPFGDDGYNPNDKLCALPQIESPQSREVAIDL